eukprot:TRINITY_DN47216_c0_g1_i1.p1 TRINITY_DN47216_c0_g1~~TRINITY_DN47216_c0_g1_i1.p1  ORF type:complete len:143 (-),score=28.59 TRINITY_DN47216_c0_g1_i1:222-650(-)
MLGIDGPGAEQAHRDKDIFRKVTGPSLKDIPSSVPHHRLPKEEEEEADLSPGAGPYEVTWKRGDQDFTIRTKCKNRVFKMTVMANKDGSSGLADDTSCENLDEQIKEFQVSGVYTHGDCVQYGKYFVRTFNNDRVHIRFPSN